jgi:TM2 domain-containing membrane protein YozV
MKNPILAVLLTWAVPGAGHFYLSKRGKALFYLVILTVTYVVGVALASFRNVSLDRHPFWFIAFAFNGGTTMLFQALTGKLPVDSDSPIELGSLYTACAGLLNILVMVDAYTYARRTQHG